VPRADGLSRGLYVLVAREEQLLTFKNAGLIWFNEVLMKKKPINGGSNKGFMRF